MYMHTIYGPDTCTCTPYMDQTHVRAHHCMRVHFMTHTLAVEITFHFQNSTPSHTHKALTHTMLSCLRFHTLST